LQISSRTLASLLLISIIVSISMTIISINRLNEVSMGITGFSIVNSTGTASVNVSATTSITFTVNTVNFGNGSVNTTGGYTNCTMRINGSATITKSGCVAFNDVNTNAPDAFIIENTGNTNIAVTINSSSNATVFIGGNASVVKYQYTLSENETNSCVAGFNDTLTNWTDVVASEVSICQNLSYVDTTDSLRLGILVVIPIDASQGNKSNIFTVTGTS
jgi:hypothetical protein